MQDAVRALACAALLLAVPATARAQASGEEAAEEAADAEAVEEAEATDDIPIEVEAPADDPIEVTIVGQRADAMQKVPGSGTVIRPEEIRRADPWNAGEMLRRVPGVWVREEPGGGMRFDVSIRGLDAGRSRRVLMLADGVPMAVNPYAEPDMLWAPPIERVQGIEVVKGSGSILFGPQTVGGVINFLTIPAPFKRTAEVELGAGQRGFFSALGRYGDRHGDTRYVTQVLFERGDGFRGNDFAFIDVFGKVSFATSARGEATLKVGFHDQRATSDDVGLTRAMYQDDPFRHTLAPDDRMQLRRYEIALTHQHRFDDHVSLRTLAYAYTTERVWRRQLFDRDPLASARYERIVGDPEVELGAIYFRDENRVLDRNYQVAGLEPRLTLSYVTGPVSHTIDVGVRVLGEAAQYEQRHGDYERSWAGALELDEARRSLAFAGYLQDRLAFLDEHLLVTPGLRVEHARYERQVRRLPDPELGGVDVDRDGSSHSTAFIPGVGMTAGIPEIHGFGGVHVGYAPPRVTSSINVMGVSEDLEPERSLIYELGARLALDRLSGELTGFLTTFENQIVPSNADGDTELVNGGATRHYGAEAAVGLELGDLIHPEVIVDLSANYTWLKAQFVGGGRDGHELPYAPNHKATAIVDLGHAVGLGGQLAYGFVGAQYSNDANTEEETITGEAGVIEAYHLLDANVRYHFEPAGLTARVSMKNALNRPYIIARRPNGIQPSGFRQITASLGWQY